jgi:hypothetical protein
MEDFGAEMCIMGLQHRINHSYDHANMWLWPHECTLTDTSPAPQALATEHSELVCVKRWDMWKDDFAVADVPIVTRLDWTWYTGWWRRHDLSDGGSRQPQ